MATTVDWATKVISIPRADLFLVQASPEIRQLDVDTFRLDLKALEASAEGMPYILTHNHNAGVTVAGTPLARVVEIVNGYTVTFEDGQYRVILVGANNNILDVATLNQVSIAPTNSAGLQDLNSLQAASFIGEVALDITSVNSGTGFPVGTREFPVNNVADAISIAEDRGLRTVVVLSDMSLASGDFSDGYTFRGDSPVVLALTLASATNITNCNFRTLTIDGTLDGGNSIIDCTVGDIEFFNGEIQTSALTGTITLGGGVQAEIINCWSGLSESVGQYAHIDMGGTGQDLVVRGFSGVVHIDNCTDAAVNSSFDMLSGGVVFDSDVSAGNFIVRGNASVVDSSTGTAVINDQTINAANEATEYNGRVTIDIGGTTGTKYPLGTHGSPVDNLADALSIAATRGFNELHFDSDFTFVAGNNVALKHLSGPAASLVTLTFDAGSITAGCTFEGVRIEGTLLSPVGFDNVTFGTVVGGTIGLVGIMTIRDSVFRGSVTLSSSLEAEIEIIDCVTGAGTAAAIFDANGANVNVSIHNYSGAMDVRGFTTAAKEAVLGISTGTVNIDSSNTDGTITVRGLATLIDNSAGSTIVDETSIIDITIVRKILQNKTITDPITGTMTVYDDDGVTPLFVAQLYEDAAETQTYQGQGAEVREALS